MSGPSSHFSDLILNNDYNIPYNNIPNVSHPERNFLAHAAHASDVSLSFFPRNLFVLTQIVALIFTDHLHVLRYCLRIS